MKKKIIIIGSVAIILIAVIVAAVLLLNNKKITITFNTDGGKSVNAIEIKKGDSIKLPDTEKEGFIFDGWYLNDTRVTNGTKFTKNEELKAKWISKDAKTFKVTFDSDGGSTVEAIVVECGKELSLPTNPTKEGYSFTAWVDKNETPVLDKALLTCEDITLKAKWEKEETNKTTTAAKDKSYKCPSGYTLNGTKCISEVSATESCPTDYTWSSKVNKCVAKTTAIDGDCPTGYTWSSSKSVCVTLVDRTKTCEGVEFGGNCYSYSEGGTKAQCDVAGGTWNETGRCYRNKIDYTYSCPSGYSYKIAGYYGWSIQNALKCTKESAKTKTCPSGYKLYHSDPNFGAGDVCVKLSDKTKTCPSGYTLSGSKCTKIINATYE